MLQYIKLIRIRYRQSESLEMGWPHLLSSINNIYYVKLIKCTMKSTYNMIPIDFHMWVYKEFPKSLIGGSQDRGWEVMPLSLTVAACIASTILCVPIALLTLSTPWIHVWSHTGKYYIWKYWSLNVFKQPYAWKSSCLSNIVDNSYIHHDIVCNVNYLSNLSTTDHYENECECMSCALIIMGIGFLYTSTNYVFCSYKFHNTYNYAA